MSIFFQTIGQTIFPKSIPLNTVPAISLYPAPSWTTPPPTHTYLGLPIPRPAIPPSIPSNRLNQVQSQWFATPSPAPPQGIRTESGEQPAAQDSVVSDFPIIRAFSVNVHDTSPPVFSHLTTHLHNTRFTHSPSNDLKLDMKKHSHPENHHHPPGSSRT